jgi:hypothetical protein
MKYLVFLLLATVVGLSGCSTDTPKSVTFEEQLAKDRAAIDSYLVSKGIAGLTDPDDYGVKYVVNVDGTGIKPLGASDSVTVNYTVRLLPAETEVEKSTAPVRFLLGNLIPGWQIGLPLIKEGSKANFYVPSGWAYGSAQQGTIPPNSNLIFEIELLKVFPQLRKDTLAINDYLVVKEIKNVLKGPEGLKYIITSLGTGVKPVSTSANPACMKMTSIAPMTTHNRLSCVPRISTSDCIAAFFLCTNSNETRNVGDPNLSVTDLSCGCG